MLEVSPRTAACLSDRLCFYNIRVVNRSAEDVRRSVLGGEWTFTMEPGYGSFAHAAAKAVEGAGSVEEALMLAAVAGFPADFVFRYAPSDVFGDAPLSEIVDAKSRETLWTAGES